MAFRSCPLMHVQSTTVAQPLIGSWITAGIGAPSNVPITITLGSAALSGSGAYDALIFHSGDPVWLIDPGGLNAEPAVIQSIVNNTQVVLGPQTIVQPGGNQNPVTTNPHVSGAFGTGTFILLHMEVNNTFVQMEDGTGGTFTYIGNDFRLASNLYRIAKLPKVSAGQNPFTWSATENFGGNPFITSELWILGGSGNSFDGYTPSFCIL